MNKNERRLERERIRRLLDVGDPLDHFDRKSDYLGPQMGIKPGEIRAAAKVLKDAFGDEWLREQATTYRKDDIADICEHPLGVLFSCVNKAEVAEVCELAHYITTLAHVPRLDVVLKHMKAVDEYETSLLQLAYAYRFREVGASELELEPPVNGGRVGDIAFRLAGAAYIAECYIPRTHPLLPEWDDELTKALEPLLRVMGEEPNTHRVLMLRPKGVVTAQERKVIVSRASRLIRGMGAATTATDEDDIISVEVRRMAADELVTYLPHLATGKLEDIYGGAHACMTSSLVPDAELHASHFQATPPRTQTHKDVVLAWSPASYGPTATVEGWANDLKEKIEEKLAQTRRADNPRRLVIVDIPSSTMDIEGVPASLDAVARRLAHGGRENFSGIIAVSRTIWRNARHGYKGRYIPGQADTTLPPDVMRELALLEAIRDITKPKVVVPIRSALGTKRRLRHGRRP